MLILKQTFFHFFQIHFVLWTGDLPFRKVWVNVYSEESSIIRPSVPLQSVDTQNGRTWETVIPDLPRKQSQCLRYKYDYEIEQASGVALKKERNYRTIRPENKLLLDQYDPSTLQVQRGESMRTTSFEGLTHRLQLLLDNFEGNRSLQTSLLDLEHMWKDSERTLTSVAQLSWTEDCLSKTLIESDGDKLVLVITMYGMIYRHTDKEHHQTKLSPSQLRQLRNTLSAVAKDQLTDWSILYIKLAGLTILRWLKQYHWLMVVAFFGRIYDRIDDILQEREELNTDVIPIETVLNVVIPRILNSFESHQEMITLLLLEIPNARCFKKEEQDQLTEVAQLNLPREDLADLEREDTNTPDVSIYLLNFKAR